MDCSPPGSSVLGILQARVLGHEGQLINLIGRTASWSSPEMATRNQSSLFLRPDLETGVSRLQRAKGQVTRMGDRGAEMPDSEPAAAATRGASQDQSRYLPKERPQSPCERRQVDTSNSRIERTESKAGSATCVTRACYFHYHVLLRHSLLFKKMWFLFFFFKPKPPRKRWHCWKQPAVVSSVPRNDLWLWKPWCVGAPLDTVT